MKLLVDATGAVAEDRARHAAAAAVRRRRRSPRRKQFTFEPGDATAASRCPSRSRSRTRSCRRRRHRRRADATRAGARPRCCAASWSSSARARRSPARRSPRRSATAHYEADADHTRPVRAALPPGPAKIIVTAPGHNPFLQQETLVAEAGARRSRTSSSAIATIHTRSSSSASSAAKRSRASRCAAPRSSRSRARSAIRSASSRRCPASRRSVSLLPFPIVRGASPSSTGFLLDGTRVPLLYHLLSGPSVIHPDFIDEIQFYPGGAPVPYGGYTGGIVDGRTARARRDEHLLDFDANLLQAGGLVREPIQQLGATADRRRRATAIPGFLLGARDEPGVAVVLGLPAPARRRHARTTAGPCSRSARATSSTRRRGQRRSERSEPAARAVADPRLPSRSTCGYHRTFGNVVDDLPRGRSATTARRRRAPTSRCWSPSRRAAALEARRRRSTLVGGRRGLVPRHHPGQQADAGDGSVCGDHRRRSTRSTSASALAEALWRPTPSWLIRPGVRADV